MKSRHCIFRVQPYLTTTGRPLSQSVSLFALKVYSVCRDVMAVAFEMSCESEKFT